MTKLKSIANPDLSTVLEEVISHIFNNFNSHQVGIVQSFDKGNQTATIQIAFKRNIEEDPDGTIKYVQYPLLVDCPCIVLSGGFGALEMPISKGDECLILFNDREIDNWFFSGDTAEVSTKRSHDLSDGIALVGVRSLKRSLQNYIDNGVKLKYNDTNIVLLEDEVEINATTLNTNTAQVNLGSGGQPIARLGDQITVTIPSGSSAGTYTGTITSSGVNTSI